MTWTVPVPDAVDGPLSGPERPILEGFLRWRRSELLRRCSGLTGEQLATASVPPSTLTLLGLLRHLAKVERIWFRQRAAGEPIGSMYDVALGRDADFDDLDPGEAEEAVARLQAEWRLADAAVAELGLDHTVVVRGEDYSLRLIYVHMISEYANHQGHADLIRERIDGVTG